MNLLQGISLTMPALFLAGFAASPHCALMCSPLAIWSAGGPRPGAHALLQIQLGRLAGYAVLGALAGLLGQTMLWQLDRMQVVGWGRLLTAGGFALAAVVMLLRREAKPSCCTPAGDSRIRKPWVRGLLWSLVPCGLLYGVLAVAVLSGSPLSGALLAAAFALGNAPALLAVTGISRHLRLPLLERHARIGAAAMMLLGALWIGAGGAWMPQELLSYCIAAG